MFTAAFDATPNQADIDGVMGFSSGTATAYTGLAAIVRFNQTGTIDVRNGANYTAAQSVPYSAGLTYHFQMAINPSTHTYTVYVTPPGGSQITLASNYAFRSEQANTSSLNNWALYVDVGSESICNLTAAAAPLITTQPQNATVTLGQAATLSVTATGNAPLAYQWKKNGASIAGATSATYTTPATTAADNGSQFTVVITDAAGSATSNSATLTVTGTSSTGTPSCVQSSTTWANQSISTESSSFTAAFDATPNQADIDGVMGFSSGAATAYTGLAAIVRFNQTGTIDVRNGANYTAAQSVPYSAGLTYHFQMAINPSTHTYTVYVTPPGGSQITLAGNYAFRSEQASTSSLNNWALYVDVGSESICNMAISGGLSGVVAKPAITSATTASGAVNSSFSYQIAATNSPTSYGASGLPSGLSINTATGLISGVPKSAGSASVTLSATNSAGTGTATLAITISAATQAQISATPSSVAFGTMTDGTTDSQQITLKNSGNATLTFSQVSVTGAGFAQTGLSTSTTIAAGASTTFHATFDPSTAGAVSGSITLATNGAPSSLVISLSGTGQATSLSLGASPTTLAFGNVLDESSSQMTASVTNSGNANVTISSVTVTGAGFSASGIANGTVLTPGQSVPLTVTFAPTSGGAVSGASVKVASNAANSPATVSLSGTGMHSVVLSWSASPTSGVTYNVFRGTSSGGEGTTPINPASITSLTYTDTNVTPGTTYYYTVEAVDSAGASAPSNQASAQIPSP